MEETKKSTQISDHWCRRIGRGIIQEPPLGREDKHRHGGGYQ